MSFLEKEEDATILGPHAACFYQVPAQFPVGTDGPARRAGCSLAPTLKREAV